MSLFILKDDFVFVWTYL